MDDEARRAIAAIAASLHREDVESIISDVSSTVTCEDNEDEVVSEEETVHHLDPEFLSEFVNNAGGMIRSFHNEKNIDIEKGLKHLLTKFAQTAKNENASSFIRDFEEMDSICVGEESEKEFKVISEKFLMSLICFQHMYEPMTRLKLAFDGWLSCVDESKRLEYKQRGDIVSDIVTAYGTNSSPSEILQLYEELLALGGPPKEVLEGIPLSLDPLPEIFF